MESLPLDVLAGIFGKLDYYDAIRYRFVSKYLARSSMINYKIFKRFKKMLKSAYMAREGHFRFAPVKTFDIVKIALENNDARECLPYFHGISDDMWIQFMNDRLITFDRISNPSVRVILHELQIRPASIRQVNEMSAELMSQILENGYNNCLHYLRHISYDVGKVILDYIFKKEVLTIDNFGLVLRDYIDIFDQIPGCKTPELLQYAYKLHPINIIHFLEISDEMIMEAVSRNGLVIDYITNSIRTKELYMCAIRQNGLVLHLVSREFVDDEMCLIAIRQNPEALRFVPKLTHQFIDLAKSLI